MNVATTVVVKRDGFFDITRLLSKRPAGDRLMSRSRAAGEPLFLSAES
jgi:hypothetical protein